MPPRRSRSHRARVPLRARRRGAAEGAAGDGDRRLLRAEAARPLRRRRGPARAARLARAGRGLARGHRRGGAEPPALRSRGRAARRVGGGRAAAPVVPEGDVRRGQGRVRAREEPAPARPCVVHPGARGAAGGERAAGRGGGGSHDRARRPLPVRHERRAHAGDVAHGGDRAAAERDLLRGSGARRAVGAPADHDGLRPLPGAAHRREGEALRAAPPRPDVALLHARSEGGDGAPRSGRRRQILPDRGARRRGRRDRSRRVTAPP